MPEKWPCVIGIITSLTLDSSTLALTLLPFQKIIFQFISGNNSEIKTQTDVQNKILKTSKEFKYILLVSILLKIINSKIYKFLSNFIYIYVGFICEMTIYIYI